MQQGGLSSEDALPPALPSPWKMEGPGNDRGMGTGLKGHLSFTCSDPVGKGIHLSSGLISVVYELCGIVTSPLGASGSLKRTCVVLTPQPAPQGVLKATRDNALELLY